MFVFVLILYFLFYLCKFLFFSYVGLSKCFIGYVFMFINIGLKVVYVIKILLNIKIKKSREKCLCSWDYLKVFV